MQTKKQVMKQIRSMLKDVRAEILKEAEHVLDSGAIDLESEPSYSCRMAKLTLVAAMRRATWQWSPLSWDKSGLREIRKLEKV